MDGLGWPLLTERFERSTVFLCDLTGRQFMSQWVGTIHIQTLALGRLPNPANRSISTSREKRLLGCADGPGYSQPTRRKPAFRPTLPFGSCHQAPRRKEIGRASCRERV